MPFYLSCGSNKKTAVPEALGAKTPQSAAPTPAPSTTDTVVTPRPALEAETTSAAGVFSAAPSSGKTATTATSPAAADGYASPSLGKTATSPAATAATDSTPSATDGTQPVPSNRDLSTTIRRRARTHSAFVEDRSVEVLITDYESVDNTFLESLGKHDKKMKWTILVGGLPHPIQLELKVDKTVALAPHVSIHADTERIYPQFGDKQSSSLKEDFRHKWTFRGLPEGFREKGMFEVRPPFATGKDEWLDATLTLRRADGTYEARADMESIGTMKKGVLLAGIKKDDIRVKETKKPPKMSSRTLMLFVPKDAPHKATLTLLNENSESEGLDVSHLFGRWSPGKTPGAHCEAKPAVLAGHNLDPKVSPTVTFKVSKNLIGQDIVSADCGHSILRHFISGEVRSVRSECSKIKKTWVIQVGPFVEHTVCIERKSKMSKVVTLTVDGTKLVEGMADDVSGDSVDDQWNCAFRLVGDRFLRFHMGEAHTIAETAVKKVEQQLLKDGEQSAYPDTVTTPTRIVHDVLIVMKDLSKFEHHGIGHASLFIDGTEFTNLQPQMKPTDPEPNISDMEDKVLQATYGILVPHVVVESSVLRGLAWPMENIAAARGSLPTAEEAKQHVMQVAQDWNPTFRSLGEGLGNFMGSLKEQWPSSCMVSQISHDEDAAYVSPGAAKQ